MLSKNNKLCHALKIAYGVIDPFLWIARDYTVYIALRRVRIFEPQHEISNNVKSLRSAWAYAQSDQSFCLSLEYSMSVKLLTEHNL